jgi:hypothetical protein
MVRECGRLSRIGLRKAPTEGARKGAGKFDDDRDFSAKTTC